jgi:hypothetical protein
MCPGIALVEETAPLAEEDGDEMDLELVEDAGSECKLGGSSDMGVSFLDVDRLDSSWTIYFFSKNTSW